MTDRKTPEQEHQERVDEDVAEFSRQWWEDHDRATDLQSRVSQIVAIMRGLPSDEVRLEAFAQIQAQCFAALPPAQPMRDGCAEGMRERLRAAWSEGFWTGPDGPQHIAENGEEEAWRESETFATLPITAATDTQDTRKDGG